MFRQNGSREEVFSNLLSRRVRTQQQKSKQRARQVYEIQTAEYCGAGIWYPFPIYGASKNQYHRD